MIAMARALNTLRTSLLRPLLHGRSRNHFPLPAISTPRISPPQQTSQYSIAPPPPSSTPSSLPRPLRNLAASSFLSSPIRSRNFSAESPDTPPNIVLIKSGKELDAAYKNAQDESHPTIFYFTAEWCGPCRFLWPDVKKLTEEFDHVKFCKVDIDLEEVGDFLVRLNISSVPTLLFFSNGRKAAEVVGADFKRIKNIFSELYRKD